MFDGYFRYSRWIGVGGLLTQTYIAKRSSLLVEDCSHEFTLPICVSVSSSGTP